MLYLISKFLTGSSLVLFLCTMAGCNSDKEEISYEYNRYKFDPKVIERLPVYDSLASVILANFALFKKYINEENSYRAYRYMPVTNDDEVRGELPKEIAPNIDRYFILLGKDLIYGFDVFKDSTIKIYVRKRFSEKSQIDIGENLSYYPVGTNIRHRELPDKDTMLNKSWQYWTRFHKRSFFDI